MFIEPKSTLNQPQNSPNQVFTGQLDRTMPANPNKITSMVSLPDATLATGSQDGPINILDLKRTEWVRSLEGHTQKITCLRFLTNKNLLASSSEDFTIKIWNLSNHKTPLQQTLQGHTDRVLALEALSDGRLASGSSDDTVKIWTMLSTSTFILTKNIWMGEDVHALVQLNKTTTTTTTMMIMMAVVLLVRDGLSSQLKIVSLETGEIVRTIIGEGSSRLFVINELVVLNDGRRLAVAQQNAEISVWNGETGECERRLSGSSEVFRSLVVMADGNLVSGSGEGGIKVWSTSGGGGLVRSVENAHNGCMVIAMLVLDDGRLVTATYDGEIKIWK